MKNIKVVWFVVAGFISLMLVTGVCVAKEVTLLVGASFDITRILTQAGVAAGWEDYYKYINQEKGGIKGAKLVLRWADDQYKLERTIAWYQTLMGGEPKPLMFCPHHTTGGIGMKSIMQNDGISGYQHTPSTNIAYPPATQYIPIPEYQGQVGMFFDWILMHWKEKRKPRFGWINPDLPMGREGAQAGVKGYAEKVGIEIVGEEYVPPVPVDTTLTLRRMILERKADFVWTNGTESTLLPLLRDAVRLGLREKVGWGGTCFLDLPDMFQSARKDPTIAKGLEGLVIPFIYRQFEEVDCPGVKFMIELSKKYRGGLPSEDMRGEYIHGVSSGMVTAEVLRLVAEKVPVEKITKDDIEPYGWWRMKDYDNMGLFGGATLTFGKDLPRIGISLRSGTHPLQIIGGEITRLKDTLYPKVFLK